MAPGRNGQGGDTAARLVAGGISPGTDSATNPGMEGRIVKDEMRRAETAILTAVLWTVTGVATATGAPAVLHVAVRISETFLILIFAVFRRKKNKKPDLYSA